MGLDMHTRGQLGWVSLATGISWYGDGAWIQLSRGALGLLCEAVWVRGGAFIIITLDRVSCWRSVCSGLNSQSQITGWGLGGTFRRSLGRYPCGSVILKNPCEGR